MHKFEFNPVSLPEDTSKIPPRINITSLPLTLGSNFNQEFLGVPQSVASDPKPIFYS